MEVAVDRVAAEAVGLLPGVLDLEMEAGSSLHLLKKEHNIKTYIRGGA